ncbi:MAG: hypothetical protein ACE10E_13870, partial [Acidiferrobacterales bacterium]
RELQPIQPRAELGCDFAASRCIHAVAWQPKTPIHAVNAEVWHDFRVIDTSLGFGAAGNVEKVQCRHCGTVVTRQH